VQERDSVVSAHPHTPTHTHHLQPRQTLRCFRKFLSSSTLAGGSQRARASRSCPSRASQRDLQDLLQLHRKLAEGRAPRRRHLPARLHQPAPLRLAPRRHLGAPERLVRRAQLVAMINGCVLAVQVPRMHPFGLLHATNILSLLPSVLALQSLRPLDAPCTSDSRSDAALDRRQQRVPRGRAPARAGSGRAPRAPGCRP